MLNAQCVMTLIKKKRAVIQDFDSLFSFITYNYTHKQLLPSSLGMIFS